MSVLKKKLYVGEPSAGIKSLRSQEYLVDYLKRDRETLDDGLFFDDCQDAADHWDENWTRCPVCCEPVFLGEENGEEVMIIEHKESMAQFYQ